MVMITTASGRLQFFKDLKEKCSADDVYSVIETAEEQMGVSYDQVEEWASNSKRLDKILQQCREMCLGHAYELHENGDWNESQRGWHYVLENDDEEREKKEQEEAERQAAHEAKLAAEELAEQQAAKRAQDLRRSVTIGFTKQYEIDEKKSTALQIDKQNVKQKRIAKLSEKNTQDRLGYDVTINKDKSTDERAYVEINGSHDEYDANLLAATGTFSDAGNHVLSQAINTAIVSSHSDQADAVQSTQEALIAMKPNDIQESMLCSRMLTAHNHAMNCFSRAAHPDTKPLARESLYKQATKLSRLASDHQEALNRYRRKGEQKITIQHVNVNEGGQAIVTGEFDRGGNDKK